MWKTCGENRSIRSSSSIAMPGGQLRTLEVRCRALPLEEVLEAQAGQTRGNFQSD